MSSASHRSSTAASHTTPASGSTARAQPSQRERAEDARIAFLNSLGVASSEIDAELKSRAKIIYENDEAVSKQDAELQKKVKQMAKDNTENEKWLSKRKQKLAEFENWSEIGDDLDNDLGDIEAMLDMLEDEERQNNVGGSSRGKPV